MSKHKKSARKKAKSIGDVTINDFANSSARNNRPKKSHTNVTEVIKHLEADKPWDDEDENFDYVKVEDAEGSGYVLKKVRKKGCEHASSDGEVHTGKDYPLDVWFLISEFIRPEDIGRFSGICRTSYAVTNTAKFWLHVYKQFYRNVPTLPKRLQPNSMFRMYGMRTSVVRALYHMYAPFADRFKIIKSEEHPDVLTRRLCMLMWHREYKSQWIYYFKMKTVGRKRGSRDQPADRPDLIQMLEDVFANSEEDCRILQITCSHFVPVPSVQGLFLTSVGVTLSQDLRHNRVQLVFGSGVTYSKQAVDGSRYIVLDLAASVKILDWWHPLYPHSNNIEMVLNQE